MGQSHQSNKFIINTGETSINMIITILAVGKIKNKAILALFNEFKKRIEKYQRINLIEIKDSDQEKESEKIIEYVENNPDKKYFLLEEQGKEYTSIKFSELMKKIENEKEIVFIVSGAYGPNKKLKTKIKQKISLSQMTFTHEMARVLLIEQIYRGIMINKNIPYHKE